MPLLHPLPPVTIVAIEAQPGTREGLDMRQYKTISADSHVVEWHNLWVERMDKRFGDRTPHMVQEKDRDVFLVDGLKPGEFGMLGLAGRKREELGTLNRFDLQLRGGWDSEARLKDMDRDGIDAEVLYPSVCFGMFRLQDIDYQHACFKAYNDWMAEQMVGPHPDRLKGLGLIPIADMEVAVAEVYRAKKIGLAGAMIPVYAYESKPYSDPGYDPLWNAAQELDMPISMHFLTGAEGEPWASGGFAIEYPSAHHWVQKTLAYLMFGGVFQRFPKLKVISAENDIGWIANFLHRMDHTLDRHGSWLNLKVDKKPTEYFQSNVFATFMDDEAGLRTWDLIGEGSLVWSNDYPHPDSTWPNSQKVIQQTFADVPDSAKQKILVDNCAQLYHFV